MDIKKYIKNKDIEISENDIDIEKLEKDLRKGYELSSEVDEKIKNAVEESKKNSKTEYEKLKGEYDSLQTNITEYEKRNTDLAEKNNFFQIEGLVIETKACEMFNLVDRRHLFDHFVITSAQKTHDWVLLAGRFDTGDNLGPFLPLCNNLGQHLDRILEITTHQNGTVARGLEHTIIGAIELSEVLRVQDGLNFGIACTDLTQQGTGIVF